MNVRGDAGVAVVLRIRKRLFRETEREDEHAFQRHERAGLITAIERVQK